MWLSHVNQCVMWLAPVSSIVVTSTTLVLLPICVMRHLLHFSQRVCDDDEGECMLNIEHTSSVMMMMMMINVVVNRELGRDYIHLLSNNSEVVRSHVHFLQCDWHWSSYDTCLERHQWVNTGHTFKTTPWYLGVDLWWQLNRDMWERKNTWLMLSALIKGMYISASFEAKVEEGKEE